ncbi:SLAM family member 5-like isoform X2 [Paroedura picta]|uniref:SLAM family member 5-like isoform X2 n=1 Tax=Paroedura picta TaxID=143630 RepID=UPI00405721E5
MRHFWWLLMAVSLPTESFEEEKTAVKIIGILGESVTFHLKTSERSEQISWLRLRGTETTHIATVEDTQPCEVRVFFPKMKGRLDVSGDCRDLQITDLHPDDSGQYTAQMGEYSEKFMLEVYKNLSESDLKVRCENYTCRDGNCTAQLTCSAGEWEDGVNYTWTSTSMGGKISSPVVQSPFQDGDMNYTCTAENPVSKASKTVSVKQTCEAPLHKSNYALISVSIILATVVILAVSVGFFLRKRQKGAAHSMPADPPACKAPDESSKTIYAQIDCLPPETQQTGNKKTQPRRKPNAQEGLHTIYASVVQPKLTTLQTDDQKMEDYETSEKSGKNTYSTVTNLQETDDPSIKTVYDTVNAPRWPEGSEFRKLL